MLRIDLKLDNISRDDDFDFSFPRCPQRCAELEKKFPGLPLLIVDRERRIVWGHDYFLLLLEHGRKNAPWFRGRFHPGGGPAVEFQSVQPPVRAQLVRKAALCQENLLYCSHDEIQRRADLDFTLNEALFQRLDVLLDVSLRPVLAAGQLGLKAALRLIDFSPADRQALLTLFLKVKFSESQQLQVMQLLEEIAFREKKSFARVLAGRAPGAAAGPGDAAAKDHGRVSATPLSVFLAPRERMAAMAEEQVRSRPHRADPCPVLRQRGNPDHLDREKQAASGKIAAKT